MNIIELANESGLTYYGMGKDRARFIHHLENFAHLVAAAARADEREAVIKLLIQSQLLSAGGTLIEAIRARGTI